MRAGQELKTHSFKLSKQGYDYELRLVPKEPHSKFDFYRAAYSKKFGLAGIKAYGPNSTQSEFNSVRLQLREKYGLEKKGFTQNSFRWTPNDEDIESIFLQLLGDKLYLFYKFSNYSSLENQERQYLQRTQIQDASSL